MLDYNSEKKRFVISFNLSRFYPASISSRGRFLHSFRYVKPNNLMRTRVSFDQHMAKCSEIDKPILGTSSGVKDKAAIVHGLRQRSLNA